MQVLPQDEEEASASTLKKSETCISLQDLSKTKFKIVQRLNLSVNRCDCSILDLETDRCIFEEVKVDVTIHRKKDTSQNFEVILYLKFDTKRFVKYLFGTYMNERIQGEYKNDIKNYYIQRKSQCSNHKLRSRCSCNISVKSNVCCQFVETDGNPVTRDGNKILFIDDEGKNTRAKYYRLSARTNPELLFPLLFENGQKSKLLISIIGAAKTYTPNEKFESKFKEGLKKVAKETVALVLTGGTNVGVMKLTGEALKDICHLDSTANAYDHDKRVRCVGIMPWGVLPQCGDFGGQGSIGKDLEQGCFVRRNTKLVKPLDHNHSDFFFIDDGSVQQFGREIQFRHNLEHKLISNFIESNSGVLIASEDDEKPSYNTEVIQEKNLKKDMSAVKLVVGGGPTVIDDILETMKYGMPVVIFSETSQAAKLFTFAYDMNFSFKWGELHELDEHSRFLQMIAEEYPDFTEIMKIEFYKKMAKCMDYKHLITIGSLTTDDALDEIILSALSKLIANDQNSSNLNSSQIRKQITLAIQWNRTESMSKLLLSLFNTLKQEHDTNESDKEVFDKMVSSIFEMLVYSLEIYRPEEASTLLNDLLKYIARFHSTQRMHIVQKKDYNFLRNQGFGTSDFARSQSILYLYFKKYEKKRSNILHVLCDSQSKISFGEKVDVYLQALADFGDISVKHLLTEEYQDDMFIEFYFFALLTNMKEIIVLFILNGRNIMAKLLLTCKVYHHMKKFYLNNAIVEENDLLLSLTENEKYFFDLAIRLLNQCSKDHNVLTHRILKQKLPNFGSETCLALAASADHKKFVSHDTCMRMLTEDIWCGNVMLPGTSWFKHGVRIFIAMFPPLFLISKLVNFKTKETLKAQGHSDHEVNKNKLTLDKKEGHSFKDTLMESYYKTCYFYSAPITKCTTNSISYIIFLIIFAYINTHKLEKKASIIEWVVFLYWIAYTLEEVKQLLKAPIGRSIQQKFHNYCSSHMNLLDILTLSLYIVAFGLRMNESTLPEARIFYAINVFLWIIRLLHVFTISPEIGPYVEMIVRMLVDLCYFLFVLSVFLLAYGITRFAILSPNNENTMDAIEAVLSVPYKQLYADSLDEHDLKGATNMTVFNVDYVDVAIPIIKVLMALYTLLAAVLLINLLIARFSSIYGSVETDSQEIWRFGRYFTMNEYERRSVLPAPLSIITTLYDILKHVCEDKNGDSLSEMERSELDGFQRACLVKCLEEQRNEENKEIVEDGNEDDQNYNEDESHEKYEKPFVLDGTQLLKNKIPLSDIDKDGNLDNTFLPVDVYYPLSPIKRIFVAEHKKSFDVTFTEYDDSVQHLPCPGMERDDIIINATTKVWAGYDDDMKHLPCLSRDHKDNVKKYRNPLGRTGVKGKGTLLEVYGPNKRIEVIITRGKVHRSSVMKDSNGKTIFEVLVIRSKMLNEINLPMGIPQRLSDENTLTPILCQVFSSSTLDDQELWLSQTDKEEYGRKLEDISRKRISIYEGPIHDPRNTDEAWIETSAFNIHDQDGKIINKYLESKSTKMFNLSWMVLDRSLPLKRRQLEYLEVLSERKNFHF